MAGLTGKTVAATYQSLLKLTSTDQQNFDGTVRNIVDGEDTASCLSLTDASTGKAILSVDGSHANGTAIQIDNSAGDGDCILEFQLSGTTTWLMGLEDGASDSLKISHSTALSTDERLSFHTAETVVNEDSGDLDFRVEGNGNANLIFVDAGNDRVGIGTATPDNALEVSGGFKCGSVGSSSGYENHAIILCDTGTAHEGGLLITNVDSASSGNSSLKINVKGAGGSGTADWTMTVVDNDDPNTIIRTFLSGDGDTGRVGMGHGSPTSMCHAIVTAADASNHAAHFECSESSTTAGDVIMRVDYSGDADVHTALAKFISFHDSGGEIGYIATSNDGVISSSILSDVRLKTDIQDTSMNGLNIINALKIRDFTWSDKANSNQIGKKVVGGFVADEVYDVYNKAVHGKPGQMIDVKDDDGNKTGEAINPMGVSSGEFISVMMKAIQELSAKVTALENA